VKKNMNHPVEAVRKVVPPGYRRATDRATRADRGKSPLRAGHFSATATDNLKTMLYSAFP
jgi:hypothetical protein